MEKPARNRCGKALETFKTDSVYSWSGTALPPENLCSMHSVRNWSGGLKDRASSRLVPERLLTVYTLHNFSLSRLLGGSRPSLSKTALDMVVRWIHSGSSTQVPGPTPVQFLSGSLAVFKYARYLPKMQKCCILLSLKLILRCLISSSITLTHFK